MCVVYVSRALEHISPIFLHGIRAWKAQESSHISPQVKEKESRVKEEELLILDQVTKAAGIDSAIVSN